MDHLRSTYRPVHPHTSSPTHRASSLAWVWPVFSGQVVLRGRHPAALVWALCVPFLSLCHVRGPCRLFYNLHQPAHALQGVWRAGRRLQGGPMAPRGRGRRARPFPYAPFVPQAGLWGDPPMQEGLQWTRPAPSLVCGPSALVLVFGSFGAFHHV